MELPVLRHRRGHVRPAAALLPDADDEVPPVFTSDALSLPRRTLVLERWMAVAAPGVAVSMSGNEHNHLANSRISKNQVAL